MAGATSQIVTKVLIPGRRASLLHRARLVDFIHEHIDRKLILICAGAGYGKTSLLVDYAHDTELPLCWLSLDEGDRDLPVFVDYMVSALEHRFPQCGQRTRSLLQNAGSALETRAAVGALVSDIYEAIPDYFVLVLDDYHLVDASLAVNQFMDELLRRLPENCHILLASRAVPSRLSLTRLIARQETIGLGTADLRFTASEIQELMRRNYGIDLTDEEAASLAAKTEGWITGILLTRHDLWSGLLREIVHVPGSEGQLFDYLATEVFALQPPELQDFLLRSAVLERLNPALCDRLLNLNRSAEILASLEQQNLFTFRLEGDWYRYHHLFQGFLRAKSKAQDPAAYAALHARAGHIFADQGLWQEAIEHYLAAELWDEAAQTICAVASEAWERGQMSALARWIEALPPTVAARYPWLAYYHGRLYLESGDLEKGGELLRQARSGFAQEGDQTGIARVLIEESVIHRQSGDLPRAIEDSKRALALLKDERSVLAGRAHRGMGVAYVLQGDISAAIEELERARALYERLGRAYDLGTVYHDLGLAYERAGNLGLSALYLRQALKYWEKVGHLGGMANTLNNLGVSQHYQGYYLEALETLEEALDKARQAGVTTTEAYVQASLGDLYRDLGELERAREAYEQALEIGQRRDIAFVSLYALLALGDLYRIQGNLAAAQYYVDQAASRVNEEHSRYDAGLYKLSRGALLHGRGDLAGSAAALEEAAAIFQTLGAKRELARAYLHLGYVAFLGGKQQASKTHLQKVVDLAREVGCRQFVVADVKYMPGLLKHAALKKVGDTFFREVSAEIRALARLKAKPQPRPSAVPESPAVGMLEIYGFGTSRVVRDGHTITSTEWDASVTKELFFLLLAHPEGLRKEEIVEALWPDTPPGKANSRFHSTAYRLRNALYAGCLVRENGVYRLALAVNHYYDVAEFNELVAQGKADPQRKEECYRKAIALYKGDYLADIYSDWCLAERERLQDEYVSMLVELATYYAERGNYETSVELARRALAFDSYREDLYRQMMQCYALAGNRAAAIKCYEECARTLKSELGVEPALETVALYQQILRGLWDRPQA